MARMLELKAFSDPRGSLTVIDRELPFSAQRVYYITGVPEGVRRGGHRHHKNRQALVCIAGSCVVDWNDGKSKGSNILDRPQNCLIVEPEDYHVMRSFSKDAVLLVLASEHYDVKDYIDQGYDS